MTPSSTGRASVFDTIEVLVDEQIEVDAIRMGDLLVLRTPQTYENAVEQLTKMFPGEHPDDVKAVVRRAMPKAPSLDHLTMELAAASPDWVRGRTETTSAGISGRRLRLIAGAVVTGVAAASVGVYALLANLNQSPFEKSSFTGLTQAADFQCSVQTQTAAECRNVAEGTIWQVTAFVGAADKDPQGYRFSHGSQLGMVWIFNSTEDRERYPQVAAFQRLYPYMTTRDRVIVGATDAPVMAKLAGALDESVLHGVGQTILPPQAKKPGNSDPFDGWPTVPPTTLVPWPSGPIPSLPRPTPSLRPSPTPTGLPVTVNPSQAPTEASRPSPTPTEPDPAEETGTPAPPPVKDEAAAPSQDGEASGPADQPAEQEQPNLSVTISLPALNIGF